MMLPCLPLATVMAKVFWMKGLPFTHIASSKFVTKQSLALRNLHRSMIILKPSSLPSTNKPWRTALVAKRLKPALGGTAPAIENIMKNLWIFMWAGSAPARSSTPAWLSTSLWLLGDLMKTQVTQWANGQDYQSAVETSLEDANLSNASIPKRFSTKDRNTEAPGGKKQLHKVPTPHITDF